LSSTNVMGIPGILALATACNDSHTLWALMYTSRGEE
jgi:hypothetical protein